MTDEAIVVITTAADRDEAGRIAEALLSQSLAACVQFDDIESLYVWKGEVARDPEVRVMIKTRSALYPEVEAAIRAAHSYETPEVIALTVVAGSADYLGWISNETGGKGGDG